MQVVCDSRWKIISSSLLSRTLIACLYSAPLSSRSKCSRAGIYKLTWTLKDDPAASPAVRDAAAQAYRNMWKGIGESVLSIVSPFQLSFSMKNNILNGSRV